ncbi:hypothetical protein PCASD_01064 [Puccinia coronata f. sp. avenae]|uniref:DUF6589 domain-containing protein n=1 Tax=Puccinia coronata f. sp. avenae TaxID=200324 RepID=A0A2N5VMX1_9BASI|nr:hypothetical protein PCASD_01064 [Puccinia coronata f. sp. avenae]
MWNITQNIFASHFGDSSNCNNLGAWHFLNTMGVYTNSAEVAKKDFLSMINVIESIHEATICYCLRVIMGTEDDPDNKELGSKDGPASKGPESFSAEDWNARVTECYNQYFSPQA